MDVINDARTGLWLSAQKYERKINATHKKIREEVQKSAATQIHRKPEKYPYLPIIASMGTYQADLMFLEQYRNYNGGYRMILNVIDANSHYLFSIPLKSKKDVYGALKELIEGEEIKRDPMRHLVTDAGTEFVNKQVRDLLSSHNITVRDTTTKTHVSIVERVNKTIRDLIERYLTLTGKYRWIDALPDIVYNYNHTWHSGIQSTPVDFTYADWLRQFRKKHKLTDKLLAGIKDKFKIGEHVRMKVSKEKFEKGATETYSNTVYEIIGYEPPISFRLAIAGKWDETDPGANDTKTYLRPYYDLLIIPKNTVSVPKKESRKRVAVEHKIEKEEKKEDIKSENIVEGKRERRKAVRLIEEI